MKYYLIKFNKDWADEFDCDGFTVMTEAEKKKYEEIFLSEHLENLYIDFYFGTNKGWEEEFTFGELWKNIFKFSEIDFNEYTVIRENFLARQKMSGTSYSSSYGIFPDIPYLFEKALDDAEWRSDEKLIEYIENHLNGDRT